MKVQIEDLIFESGGSGAKSDPLHPDPDNAQTISVLKMSTSLAMFRTGTYDVERLQLSSDPFPHCYCEV